MTAYPVVNLGQGFLPPFLPPPPPMITPFAVPFVTEREERYRYFQPFQAKPTYSPAPAQPRAEYKAEKPWEAPACPPDQFWDGRQCRRSVSAIPTVPVGGLFQPGGGPVSFTMTGR